jgi:hypothetical protein
VPRTSERRPHASSTTARRRPRRVELRAAEERHALTLEAFATDFASANAWRIGKVAGKHKVVWITERPVPVVEPHDPASGWLRFVRSIEKVLPIRSLL